MKKEKVFHVVDAERFQKMTAALQDAQDFFNAYRVLQAHNRDCITTKELPIFTVDVVNLTFGIELFLKVLLYGAGKKVHGHKLSELFEYLPRETRTEIKKAFMEHLVKTTGNDHDIFGLTFEDRLKQYANTFQDWRYFHEKGQGNFNSRFCENLAYVLNEIAHAQLKELQLHKP